jgi:excisionase family DNA binding protein
MKWLTTGEVAERIGRSSRAVRDLLDDERFDYFDGAYRLPGGQYRIPELAVDAFLARLRTAAKRVRRGRNGDQNGDLV